MTNFTREQIDTALRTKSEHLSPDDIRRIAGNRAAVMKMVDEFPEHWAKARRQATLLFDMIEAAATGKAAIHPDDLKCAAGALIYLGAALDIVPDDESDGYADDAAIVGLAVAQSDEAIRVYCRARGLDPADYVE